MPSLADRERVSGLEAQAAKVPGRPPSVMIKPASKWGSLDVRELWAYRELFYFMTKRELQIRYKQSMFGAAWAVAQPVALMLIFSLFFGRVAGIDSDGVPYPIFALAALVPWVFISQSVGMSAASLIGDANLLSKVYFPRIVLPVARIAALAVDLVLALAVLAVFKVAYGLGFTVEMLTLPLFLLLALLIAVGSGVLLAAVNVRYRDVAVAVPLLLQVWLFTTPVIYPASLIAGDWKYLFALNPATGAVDGFRWAFLGTPGIGVGPTAVSAATALAVFAIAIVYFRRTEQSFADII